MAPVRLPGTRPRELETVAVTGGRPTASSTGKVTRVPDPTTALMPPAANPAAATATICHPVMRPPLRSLARRCRRLLAGGGSARGRVGQVQDAVLERLVRRQGQRRLGCSLGEEPRPGAQHDRIDEQVEL